MRAISAFAGALLLGCAGVGLAQAGEISAPQTAPTPLVARCDAPVANPNARPKRHVRRVVRRYRAPPVRLVRALPPPLVVYNPWLPSTYNGAYDRVMVQHFQAPPVSGIYAIDSELPTTPPAVPFQPYRMQASGNNVLQYDGITGEYIPLSQRDAHRVLAASPLPVLKEDD